MNSERWRLAWDLFDEAACLPVQQRDVLLAKSCVDDPEIQRLVSGWLRADADSADFLDDGWLAREVLAAPDLVGRRLGSCQITGRLGQGGMGTVYLAHQIDEIFDRQVAVKVLSWRPFGEEARGRFQIEQQALGRLDHPAVARIYDGGTTEEGFPYLILEYVPGEPLDRYCESHNLSVARRVALLRRVCGGVAASHHRLIVHSDLKPSNILVREDGQPKLLDFGIARLLDPAGSSSSDPGHPVSRPLTPRYASPEQLRGEWVTTASDVFSLGVILHQVLYRALPATTAEELARAPRGELDCIVLKALHLDPEQRYPSAESLGEDLGRYLRGLPVEARRGGRGYRVLKWIQRNRWPTATALAALVALLIFSGGLWLNKLRLEQERNGLQEVARFFSGVFEQAGPFVAEGVDVSLKEALDRSADYLASGPQGEPGVHATLVAVLGEIYLDLGEPEKALAWSQQAHALHTTLRGEKSREAAASLDMVGAAQRELEHLDEAEKANRDALAILRANPTPDRRLLIRSLNNRVSLHCWRENYQAAMPRSTEALALARASLAPEDSERIAALLQHAQVMSHVGDPQLAVTLYREAQAILERENSGVHPQLALLHNNLAKIYSAQGRLDEMVAELEIADHQYEELFGPDNYQRVRPLLGLAIVAKGRGEVERAIELYGLASEIGRQTTTPSFILRPIYSMARFLLAEGRCREAEKELRASLERLSVREERPWRYHASQSLLGESLLCQGRLNAAALPLRQGLAGLEPDREKVPKAYQRAAESLEQLRQLSE